MGIHCVLEVDRSSASPSALQFLQDVEPECIPLENEDRQNSADHIVTLDLSDTQLHVPQAGLHENEKKSGEAISSFLEHAKNTVAVGNIAECRICQEEDEERYLETPCGCSGTVKFAHRKCIQRWCDEKGNTICEICQQPYQRGYTATPRPDDPSEEWGLSAIHQLDPHDQQRFIALVAAQHRSLETAYGQFTAGSASSTACCRSAALVLMALLLLRHALSIVASGVDEDASTLFTLFLLRAAGFLLPCYILARALDMLQRRRQRQEASLAAAELALLLQRGTTHRSTLHDRL